MDDYNYWVSYPQPCQYDYDCSCTPICNSFDLNEPIDCTMGDNDINNDTNVIRKHNDTASISTGSKGSARHRVPKSTDHKSTRATNNAIDSSGNDSLDGKKSLAILSRKSRAASVAGSHQDRKSTKYGASVKLTDTSDETEIDAKMLPPIRLTNPHIESVKKPSLTKASMSSKGKSVLKNNGNKPQTMTESWGEVTETEEETEVAQPIRMEEPPRVLLEHHQVSPPAKHSSNSSHSPATPAEKAKEFPEKSKEALLREKWQDISFKALIQLQLDQPSRVYKLRGYHSEPILTLPFDEKFEARSLSPIENEGNLVKLREKFVSCEDILFPIARKEYPTLMKGPTSNVGQLIDDRIRCAWREVQDLEKRRFSFYDELFYMGYIADSLEVSSVPPKCEENRRSVVQNMEYFVEAEERHYRKKVDYGRVVFKTKHVYTGNFIDWYFQGTGRYTWIDGTIYQGEFSHGLMHGPGSIHWPDGSVYEGHFINGIRTGWGVFSTVDGYTFAGEWMRGLPHGHGKMWYDPDDDDNDYYEGQWVNGFPQGAGTRQYSTGDRYVGNWDRGIRNGYGIMIWLQERQCYKGEWSDGVPNGFGKHIWYLQRSSSNNYPTRHVYHGDWVMGRREGIGKMIYPCGSMYEGRWHNGQRDGKGMFVNPAGDVLVGLFRAGSIVGGSDVPLHAPTYECDYSGLIEWLTAKFTLKFNDVGVVEDEERLHEVIRMNLPYIRKLYCRAGEYSQKYGSHGLYPAYVKKVDPNSNSSSLFDTSPHQPLASASKGGSSTRIMAHTNTSSQHIKYSDGEHGDTNVSRTNSKPDSSINHEDVHVDFPAPTPTPYNRHHRAYSRFDEADHMKGKAEKPHALDGVNPVTRFGLWLLIRDCQDLLRDVTMAYYDKLWCETAPLSFQTKHNPFEPVHLWQFLQCLIVAAVAYNVDIPKRKLEETNSGFPVVEPPAISDAMLQSGMSPVEKKRAVLAQRRKTFTKEFQMTGFPSIQKKIGRKEKEEEAVPQQLHEHSIVDKKRTKKTHEDKEKSIAETKKKSAVDVFAEGENLLQQAAHANAEKEGGKQKMKSKGFSIVQAAGHSISPSPQEPVHPSLSPDETNEAGERDEDEGSALGRREEIEMNNENSEEENEDDEEFDEEESELAESELHHVFDDDEASEATDKPANLNVRKSVILNTDDDQHVTEEPPEVAEPEPPASISEIFESFLTSKLIPTLTRDPGTNLPPVPDPLPTLVDMYEAFKSIQNTDILKGTEFILSALPHLQFPNPKDTIWWHRCPESLSHPTVNIEDLLSTLQEKFPLSDDDIFSSDFGETPTTSELDKGETGYLGLDANKETQALKKLNLDNSPEVQSTANRPSHTHHHGHHHSHAQEIDTFVVTDSSQSSSTVGSALVFSSSNQTTFDNSDVADKKTAVATVKTENDVEKFTHEGTPFAKDDLTTKPFLWADDYKCVPVQRKYQHFEQISTHDVFTVLHNLYPGILSGEQEKDLHFDLIFCDWLWCTSLLAKASTEREFQKVWKVTRTELTPRTNPDSYGVYSHYVRQIKNNPYLSLTPPADFIPKRKPREVVMDEKGVRFHDIATGVMASRKSILKHGSLAARRTESHFNTFRKSEGVRKSDFHDNHNRKSEAPDGHKKSEFPEGHRKSEFPEGHRKSEFPEGHRKSEFPEGHRKSEFPEGHRKSEFPEGQRKGEHTKSETNFHQNASKSHSNINLNNGERKTSTTSPPKVNQRTTGASGEGGFRRSNASNKNDAKKSDFGNDNHGRKSDGPGNIANVRKSDGPGNVANVRKSDVPGNVANVRKSDGLPGAQQADNRKSQANNAGNNIRKSRLADNEQ